jgi:glycosyltransferase involved in cell wall biosynthesis
MPARVSVVIPVYNLGAYLAAAVKSALTQTYQDFEIVIIDDGSTEAATVEAVDGYNGTDRVRVLRTANHGLAAARNRAIEASEGQYVLPLDADDLLAPQFLERTVPVLERHPSVGFVYTTVRVFGEYEAEWAAVPFDPCVLLTRNIVGCASALVRKAAWRDVGGYDTAFREGFEDWDFFVRLARASWDGFAVPEALMLYRRRQGSMLRRCEDPNLRPALVRRVVERNREAYAARLTDVLVCLNQQLFLAQRAERHAWQQLTRVYERRRLRRVWQGSGQNDAGAVDARSKSRDP